MRTVRYIIIAGAVAICGCQTVAERPPHDEHSLVGDWRGNSKLRAENEVQIEAVHEDRSVSGTACGRENSGVIVGQRLERIATQSESGLSIRFDIGRASFHMRRDAPRKAILWETWTRRDGTLARPLRATLTRTSKPGCVERYRAEPKAPRVSAAKAEQPLIGRWTGQWQSGTIAEMAIMNADASGNIEATYCTRRPSGRIAIFDLRRGGTFKTRLDPKTNKITFEERWRWGRKTAFRFELRSPDFARLETAKKKGRTTTSTVQLAMRRGINARGCLVYIETAPARDG